MRLIIDANIFFAALIKDGFVRKILCDGRFAFYAPDLLIDEMSEHTADLEAKTHLSKSELLDFFDKLVELSGVQVISAIEIKHLLEEARKVCPDLDDVPYFALAMKLDCPVWSEDRRLKKQDSVKVVNTADLINQYF